MLFNDLSNNLHHHKSQSTKPNFYSYVFETQRRYTGVSFVKVVHVWTGMVQHSTGLDIFHRIQKSLFSEIVLKQLLKKLHLFENVWLCPK